MNKTKPMQDQATKRVNKLLAEFSSRQETFSSITLAIETLLRRLLPETKVHKIESRTKTKANLREKLFRPEKSYIRLDDVTDICGVRVITYFADHVPEIYKVIDREFKVEEANDKADLLNPDQFGYLSFHCIVTLPKSRTGLTENREYKGLKAEIQIRSILQHAWAEIEHNLGYKSTHAVPKQIRRPISRLAGLLELGDSEFKRIRDELIAIEKEIERGIHRSPTALAIDKNSVAAFVKYSDVISRIETAVSSALHLRIVFSDTFVETYVEKLGFLGVSTIGATEGHLVQKQKIITKFLIAWFRGTGRGRLSFLPAGLSISFLVSAIVLEKGGLAALTDFFARHAFNKNQNIQKLACDVELAYKNASRVRIARS